MGFLHLWESTSSVPEIIRLLRVVDASVDTRLKEIASIISIWLGRIRFRLISDRELFEGGSEGWFAFPFHLVEPFPYVISELAYGARFHGESRGKVGLPFLRLENDHGDFTPPPSAILIRSISTHATRELLPLISPLDDLSWLRSVTVAGIYNLFPSFFLAKNRQEIARALWKAFNLLGENRRFRFTVIRNRDWRPRVQLCPDIFFSCRSSRSVCETNHRGGAT